MKSDARIKLEGMRALRDALGLVDAGKFIMMVKRDSFDYTEWQGNLWADKSVDQIFTAARDFEKQHKA